MASTPPPALFSTLSHAPVDLWVCVVRNRQVAALLPGPSLLVPDGDDQSASLRAGAAWAAAAGTARRLLVLADMPPPGDATVAAVVAGCTDRPSALRRALGACLLSGGLIRGAVGPA